MAKLTLGKNRPKTFETPVSIPLLDGSIEKVRCTFKNLKRSEYATLMDEHTAGLSKRLDEIRKARVDAAEAANVPGAEAAPDAPGFSAALVAAQADADADLLLRLCEAWDLADPLNKTTLLQLFDEIGGSANHLQEACRAGIVEGRLGN